MPIYQENISGKISKLKFAEDFCKFFIGDKEFKITSNHDQDCCERVYCDFSMGQASVAQINDQDADFLRIEGVKDAGILLCFSDKPEFKIFLGCYNQQNGYYSDDLSIVVNEKEFDITSFKKDDID